MQFPLLLSSTMLGKRPPRVQLAGDAAGSSATAAGSSSYSAAAAPAHSASAALLQNPTTPIFLQQNYQQHPATSASKGSRSLLQLWITVIRARCGQSSPPA